MRKNFFTTIKHVVFIAILFLATSCALQKIPSDYTYITTTEKPTLDNLGEGKILIYNGAGFMHKVDNTASLNIWIDDKALGQIRPSEYVIIDLEKGKHHFKVLHLDMVNMRSNDDIEIDEKTKVIEIKPTISSNKITVTNVLPKNFEKFKYAVKK